MNEAVHLRAHLRKFDNRLTTVVVKILCPFSFIDVATSCKCCFARCKCHGPTGPHVLTSSVFALQCASKEMARYVPTSRTEVEAPIACHGTENGQIVLFVSCMCVRGRGRVKWEFPVMCKVRLIMYLKRPCNISYWEKSEMTLHLRLSVHIPVSNSLNRCE